MVHYSREQRTRKKYGQIDAILEELAVECEKHPPITSLEFSHGMAADAVVCARIIRAAKSPKN